MIGNTLLMIEDIPLVICDSSSMIGVTSWKSLDQALKQCQFAVVCLKTETFYQPSPLGSDLDFIKVNLVKERQKTDYEIISKK